MVVIYPPGCWRGFGCFSYRKRVFSPGGLGGSTWRCGRWKKTAACRANTFFLTSVPLLGEGKGGKRLWKSEILSRRPCTNIQGKAQSQKPFFHRSKPPQFHIPRSLQCLISKLFCTHERPKGFTPNPILIPFCSVQNSHLRSKGGPVPRWDSGDFPSVCKAQKSSWDH